MRRQNSVPTAEPPTQLNAVASAMRRLSHDLRLPRLFAERVSGGDHTITHTNKKKPIQPSIFSTGRRNTQQQRQQQQTTAVTTPPRSYTFGYASAARISPSVPSAIYDDDADDDDDDDDEMASEDFDSTGERPTTSSAYGAATKSEGCKAAAATTTIDDVNTIDVELGVVEAELYVCRIGGGGSGSNGGGTLVPLYARCVGGEAADRFCESLDSALRERLRRFLVAESPAADEWHVWLRCDATGETIVVALQKLLNHLRNDNVRRVKWRTESHGKVVYRYSVPAIKSKCRLRFQQFFSAHYRCIFLFVWCLVILLASLVMTIVFGSSHVADTRNATHVFAGNQMLFGRGERHNRTAAFSYSPYSPAHGGGFARNRAPT